MNMNSDGDELSPLFIQGFLVLINSQIGYSMKRESTLLLIADLPNTITAH
jgi:hypothetical protein